MKKNLLSGVILGFWLLGMVLFFIGLVLSSVYSIEDPILKYIETNCTIHGYTIGQLNVCDTGPNTNKYIPYTNIYKIMYMAVWNASLVNKELLADPKSNRKISTIMTPVSRYLNRSLAVQNIEDGPVIGSTVSCLCPNLKTISIYPNLNDDNDINCDVWKACLLDVTGIKSEQNIIITGHTAGNVLFYLGIGLETILTIVTFITFCVQG